LLRLGVHPDAVEDATQDALLVVHRRRDEFRGESRWDTWFFGVLLRVAQSYRRQASCDRSRFLHLDSDALDPPAASEPSPLDVAERRAAAALLHALLQELPDPLREIFVLVELEELELQAAADVLGWSLSTAKGRLRDARKSFNAVVDRTKAQTRHREVRSWSSMTKTP
jgi:RNA polymerase sigma-70 factor (ECF subfamily)